MTFAVTIGSYGLPQFVELGVKTIRENFPKDTPILISDDRSALTEQIEAVAKANDCAFKTSRQKRGHFAGDMQAVVNSLAFAKWTGRDIAVKIAQRFIVLSPEIPKLVAQRFEDNPTMDLMLPGRPPAHTIISTKFFQFFPQLTDIVFLRPSVDAGWAMNLYREKVRKMTHHHQSFVEFFFDQLCRSELKDRHQICSEITEDMGRGWFLRRYQHSQQRYMDEARKRGIYAPMPTTEWQKLDRGYACVPRAV